ncbi:MAG: lipid 3-O-deacylase [Verrucomicrobiota bacterium]|jgi:opacity protein-like surface antigen
MIRSRRLSLLFLSVLALSPVFAGEDRISTSFQPSELGYVKGTREIEVFGGAFTSVNYATRKRPQFDFALASVREGWMLNDTRSGIFFGNEEFLIDAFAGPILKGPGSVMAGATLILRHNFVTRSGAFFVPYYQMGAGGLYSDAANADRVQFGIGTTVEFNLQATLGARWRVNPSWSVNTEFGYRHISNGGLDSRNGGVDAVGGFIGLGRMF